MGDLKGGSGFGKITLNNFWKKRAIIKGGGLKAEG